MSGKKGLSRRDFLKLSGVVAVGSGLAACSPSAPPATQAPAVVGKPFDGKTVRMHAISGGNYDELYKLIPQWEEKTGAKVEMVFKPRMKGNYLRLLRALARRRFVPIGTGRNRRTVVFDRDAARAAVLALRGPLEGGGAFNASDGHIHTVAEIISAICSAPGRRPPRVHLPVVLGRCLAGIAERVARAKQVPPLLTRVAVEKYIEDVAVDATKIKRELGYIPAFGLDIGWQTTIREMRQVGAL